MIQSMTGYGKAVTVFGDKKINVEIKSLNSKAMDLSTRIAPLYREKEMEIRNLIAQTLERGKVDFSIWVEKDLICRITEFYMEYNTQQRKLPLPEYGRSVQNMVDHALTIEDREERQRCANTIVNIMGGMFPQLRDMEDFRHKLWDHLAIMSDFKLDIDYPVEIVKKESLEVKPDRIPYSPNVIRFRHYGRFIQDLIKIAVDYPEGDEKKQLIKYIANHMKKDYINFNKDGVEDQKILEDLCELSEGRIKLTTDDLKLVEQRSFGPRRRQMNNNNQQKKKY